MLKHLLKPLCVAVAACLAALPALADTFIAGDFVYETITDSTVAVIGLANYDLTEVVIPDKVESNGITYSVTEIGNYAFNGGNTITSITIPESVTEIGEWAFFGCSKLTQAYFASIEAFCKINFADASANPLINGASLYINGNYITSLKIPNTVTKIGQYAFYSCNSLTSVTIPESVTEIGQSAFSYCSGLTSVTIPESVKKIGDYAFYGCSGLTSITLPNALTEIGRYAFSGCSGLTSVTIPESVTEIGQSAFSGCSGLTSVTIPESVTEIGKSAFSGCSGLTSVTIPASVKKIGDSAFYGCENLTKAEFTSLAAFCQTEFGSSYANPISDGASLYIDGKEISLSSLEIPNTVTKIGAYVFYDCTGLKSITIPESVTEIGDHAFSYCSSLTSVTLPDALTEIGQYAFSHCSTLTSVTLPDALTEIGRYAFSHCSTLTSVTLPKSVKMLGENAFEYSGIKHISLPDSIKVINNRTFYRCDKLVSVTLPAGLTTIDDLAFAHTTLKKLLVKPDAVGNIYLSDYSFEDVPTNCLMMYPSNISFTKSQSAPYYFSPIPSNFVKKTYNKKQRVYEDGILWNNDKNVIFYADGGISEVYTVPNGVTSINESAFENCGITKLVLSPSVQSIGKRAFYGNSLRTVAMGANLTSINESAFENCGITKLVLSPSVQSIGKRAFYDNSLRTVAMGANLTSIGDEAFAANNALSAIYISALTPPTTAANAFSSTATKAYLNSDEELIAYLKSSAWRNFDVDNMVLADTLAVSGLPGKYAPGDTIQLTATLAPEDNSMPYVFWRSSNPEVAEVDANGLVIYHGGACTITAETLYANGPIVEITIDSTIETGEEPGEEPGDDEQAAIKALNAEADVEYFNLHGLKVEATRLTPGIYIRRTPQGTTKVRI